MWQSSPWVPGWRSVCHRDGGMLHDLGKIAILLEVLRKPGLLNEEEWRIMCRHPVLGADLLARLPGSNRLPLIVAFEHTYGTTARGIRSSVRAGASTRSAGSRAWPTSSTR